MFVQIIFLKIPDGSNATLSVSGIAFFFIGLADQANAARGSAHGEVYGGTQTGHAGANDQYV